MQSGGAFPGAFAAAPCPQNALLSRSDKYLALASGRGNLGIVEAASQMLRFLGPMDGGGRRDI